MSEPICSVERERRYAVYDPQALRRRLGTLGMYLGTQRPTIEHWFVPSDIPDAATQAARFDSGETVAWRITEHLGSGVTLESKQANNPDNHDKLNTKAISGITTYDSAVVWLQRWEEDNGQSYRQYLTYNKIRRPILPSPRGLDVVLDTIPDLQGRQPFCRAVEIEAVDPDMSDQNAFLAIDGLAAQLGLQEHKLDVGLPRLAIESLADFNGPLLRELP